jgi:hypothetical protein
VCQGDVFDDIPFVRFPYREKTADDAPKGKRGPGMVMGHPCDVSPEEKGAVTPWRTLCRVVEDKDALVTLDGTGHFFAFPLPGLKGDETVWYADFRFTTVVDERYLNPDRRIAALSLDGWLALQRRIAHFYSRGLLDVSYLAINAAHHPDGSSFAGRDQASYRSDFISANQPA